MCLSFGFHLGLNPTFHLKPYCMLVAIMIFNYGQAKKPSLEISRPLFLKVSLTCL